MTRIKVEMCWQYYKSLSKEDKNTQLGKYLRCACECAIKLLEQNSKLESENIDYRLNYGEIRK